MKQATNFNSVFHVEQSEEIDVTDFGEAFGKERRRLDRMFHVEQSALRP